MAKMKINLNVSVFDKNLSREDLKKELLAIADEDYNGNNGDDYLVEMEDDRKISGFEAKWETFNEDDSVAEIVESIIEDMFNFGYDCDEYYADYTIIITETRDTVVASVAYGSRF